MVRVSIWGQDGRHFWGNVSFQEEDGTWPCSGYVNGVILEDFSLYLSFHSEKVTIYATTSYAKLILNPTKKIEVVSLRNTAQTSFGSYIYTDLPATPCTVGQ